MNKDLKILISVIGILVIFASSLIVYGAYYAPLTVDSYENQIVSVNNEFLQIEKEDSRYVGTSQETPKNISEYKVKMLIDQMDSLQKRGIPAQYNNFHSHYTDMLVNYLKWVNIRDYELDQNDLYINTSIKELNLAYDSFNKVSTNYKFGNNS